MQKPVAIFLVCLAIGLVALFFYRTDGKLEPDVPTRMPNRTEIVPPGSATTAVIQTSDETRIPELMQPTPFVKSATKKLLHAACEHGTDRCKLQAIYDFVRLNYEYSETSIQHTYIQAPDQTLIYGTGDALELALLMSSMQRAASFENEILIAPYHTFVRTHYGNTTIMIDPSCVGCRFMGASVSLSGNEKIYS